MLVLLVFVPITVLIYLRLQRRRQALGTSFGGMWSAGPETKRHPRFRRHLPPALFLASLAVLLVALARPQAEINLPRVEGIVILVVDVSGSMAAKDVEPTRMEAARETARAFILSQPQTIRIGIVSFSGNGFVVQGPTNDTAALLATIDRLEPQAGTSLGQGIVTALNTLAIDAGLAPAAQPTPQELPDDQSEPQEAEQQRMFRDEALLAQLPEGPYPPSVIVLLSDGENNQSIDPFRAAQAAAERDVRIDALGFGTPGGAILEIDGFSVYTALDEAALQQITQAAGGAYYNPQNEQHPQAIYKNLVPELVIKPETMEITSIFAGASLFILMAGAVLSLLWFNRLP